MSTEIETLRREVASLREQHHDAQDRIRRAREMLRARIFTDRNVVGFNNVTGYEQILAVLGED